MWTTDTPTAPGYYWHRDSPAAPPEVVELVEDDEDGLVVVSDGEEVALGEYADLSGSKSQWQGPIHPAE